MLTIKATYIDDKKGPRVRCDSSIGKGWEINVEDRDKSPIERSVDIAFQWLSEWFDANGYTWHKGLKKSRVFAIPGDEDSFLFVFDA